MQRHHTPGLGSLVATAVLFSSAPGFASYPTSRETSSAEHHIRAVETITDEVVRLAERRARQHHIPGHAMAWVRELENRADHLYAQMERYRGDVVRHTEDDYRNLAASYRDALRAEPLIGDDHEVRRVFAELRASMDGLDRAYRRGGDDAIRLSRDLARRADRLHRRIERQLYLRGDLTPGERTAVVQASRFAGATRRLADELETRRHRSRHARSEADQVSRLYALVRRSARLANVSWDLQRQLSALAPLVRDLARIDGANRWRRDRRVRYRDEGEQPLPHRHRAEP